MKIIITATSPSIDSTIDPRFGRGAYFVIVDLATMDWQSHANPSVGATGGAGTQAAQFAVNQQVSAVISGDFGPNACHTLQAANIAMYLFGENTTVRQAIEQFNAGQLTRICASTVPGHHN